MKDRFPEFYNDLEFEELWNKCTFVFDTNILINLYTSPKEDYNQFANILDEISDRLWMPHQIGWEYQKNRYNAINKAEDTHNALKSLVNDLNLRLKKIKNSITELQVDCVDFGLVNECLDEIKLSIEKMNYGITNFNVINDKIRDKFDSLYNGKIGEEYSPSRLKELYKDAEYRYASNIPPGFKDKAKRDGNPYGDLILWNQMIDYARDNSKSIIFITEDTKADWWLNKKPHPFLIKEFFSTGQDFYMYNFSDFLTQAKKYLITDIKQETIDKVKDFEKLRDCTDYSHENAVAFAFHVFDKDPELVERLINREYIPTLEDDLSLFKIVLSNPALFRKILIESGQNFTPKDQEIFDLASKHPNLIDTFIEEQLLINANNDSKTSKKGNQFKKPSERNKSVQKIKIKKSF